MLPLQPKLLPGYNLQSSFLSSTLSTVRPPDVHKNGKTDFFKPNIEVIVEKRESITESIKEPTSYNVNDDNSDSVINCENLDRDFNVNNLEHNDESDVEIINENHNNISCVNEKMNEQSTDVSKDVMNSNVLDINTVDTSLNYSSNEDSPNNNSY